MTMISLAWWDVALAALLVMAIAGLSFYMRLALERQILIAGARTVLQLVLMGLILKTLFEEAGLLWIALMAVVMLAAAVYETMVRQKRRFIGWWAPGISAFSLFVSSFAVTLFALLVVIGNQPWYMPQYAVPLLGMMLGNTMTGVALSLDRLTQDTWRQRAVIEQRLMLGQSWKQALAEIRHDAMRAGMMPTINAMATVGLVSLPGMMTGQILAGSPPMEAVKYQILIMFMVTASVGFGTVIALHLAARRLFDERQRLRLNRVLQ